MTIIQKEQERFEKEFDEEYDIHDEASWSVGIVASALTYARSESLGSDASYITKKLRDLIRIAKEDERKRVVEKVEEFVKSNQQQLYGNKDYKGGIVSTSELRTFLNTLTN